MAEVQEKGRLQEVLDRAVDEPNGERISLRDLLESQSGESFGPALFLLALVAISPIGMIPGMSIVTGSLIILIAGQLLFFRPYPWLPNWLLSKSFSRKKLEGLRDRLGPWVRRLNWLVRPRLEWLTQPPGQQVLAGVCIGLALLFYPLALVPFGVAAPASAILVFSAALTARDGILAVLGLLLSAVTLWVTVQFWPF